MATNDLEQNSALFHALRLSASSPSSPSASSSSSPRSNILISLIMMVMEKTKDIAVLMSMGTRRAQVRNLFIAQGVLNRRDRHRDRPRSSATPSPTSEATTTCSRSRRRSIPSTTSPSPRACDRWRMGRAIRGADLVRGHAVSVVVRRRGSSQPRPCAMSKSSSATASQISKDATGVRAHCLWLRKNEKSSPSRSMHAEILRVPLRRDRSRAHPNSAHGRTVPVRTPRATELRAPTHSRAQPWKIGPEGRESPNQLGRNSRRAEENEPLSYPIHP